MERVAWSQLCSYFDRIESSHSVQVAKLIFIEKIDAFWNQLPSHPVCLEEFSDLLKLRMGIYLSLSDSFISYSGSSVHQISEVNPFQIITEHLFPLE